jgi:hypothetical protein
VGQTIEGKRGNPEETAKKVKEKESTNDDNNRWHPYLKHQRRRSRPKGRKEKQQTSTRSQDQTKRRFFHECHEHKVDAGKVGEGVIASASSI